MEQWRLIVDVPAAGARNMAVDHAILEAVIAGTASPTLRFYQWHPACLSLGYGQHAHEVDLARLTAHRFGVVRRPTGGQAVLHADELTYSIALPDSHPLAQGSIVESYRRLSDGLIAGLKALGIAVRAEPRQQRISSISPVVCFESTSDYEITCNGRKLVGSAQMRKRGGVLQHGSLPLVGDAARICEVLRYDTETARQDARKSVLDRATTLEAETHTAPLFYQVAETLAEALAAAYEVLFVRRVLDEDEHARAIVLEDQIYGSDSWTFRR
ncbi:MAG: lipoate--protein ligase family protein [Anaerolineae bacterium]|nr:lipoate--protein ligase family protein [Anaerolineae bacterium]